jgi:LPXTG-site transpeptidase (sortase) family protein
VLHESCVNPSPSFFGRVYPDIVEYCFFSYYAIISYKNTGKKYFYIGNMLLSAVLYSNHFQPYCYRKAISPVSRDQFQSLWMVIVGYGCITLASFGALFLNSPLLLAEGGVYYRKLQKNLLFPKQNSSQQLVISKTTQAIPTPDPATLPFSLLIPKIEVSAKVISNVDASDEEAYSLALKEGVAHALGSAFPGQGKMVYIFGHSTDYPWNVANYNALFYQIKDLEIGDTVTAQLGSQAYAYTVTDKKIIEANDVHFLESYQNQNVMILQTCYPPGTNWQRLLVITKPIKLNSAS